jgi:tetratricopeptide (TPR) repeat protein
MEIQIMLAGQQLGPFSETQVRKYLEEGLLSPSDLALSEGMEEWQPVDLVLANLPPSAPAPEAISPDAPPPEPPAPSDPPPEPEPPLTMHTDAPETFELASAPPPAERVPPKTDSQKTKRKVSKIVIQPILPLEATASTRKKPRTGKTALTLEPLRPTTSLPPVAGFVPKEKKSGKAVIPPGQLSLMDFPEKPVAAPTATPPAAPVTPAAPATTLPESTTGTPAAKSGRIPRVVVYVCALLAFLILCLILSYLYRTSLHPNPAPASGLVQPENASSSNRIETLGPQAAPKTAADFSARGFARQAEGDLDGAIADYDRALGLDPKDLQASYRRGLARQAKGDWSGAIADYNAVLSHNPRDADAFSNLGFVKQSQGDLDGALADYAQALLINPKIPGAYYNEGLIEVQQGYLDGAIADFNHALDLDPKMALAYYNRGNAKNAEGNMDGAIADYTQALALNPKIAPAYYKRGFARQSKGDLDGAFADYNQALAVNPKMAPAFYNRGLIKVQKGDLDGAILDNTQAIDLDPKNGQPYCNRGLARLGKGNLDGAMTDLRKFCELVPRDGGADYARLYIWLISTEENPKGNADEELAAALQNDWNSSPEDLSSKIAAFLLGHINEGALIANTASPDPSREPGQYCKAWYFAGMKRLLAGDKATASAEFQKCLATDQKASCEYIFAQAELRALGQSETPVKSAASR